MLCRPSVYVCILIAISIVSCSKEGTPSDPDRIYSRCLISKYYSSGDTLNNSTRFSYDSQDRITRINWPSPAGSDFGSQFTYQPNKVRITDIQNTSAYTIYYLSTDTLSYASASYNNGIRTDTVNFIYEAGRLIKTVRYNYVFGKDSSFLTYSGNNLTLIKTYSSNGAIEQASFEYNTTVSKDWYYQNFGPYLHFTMYYPWFGKTNGNLIKSYSYTYNGNASPMQHTYSLNASGYVTKVNMLYRGIISQGNYEYICR
jgi:hypothetical protein